MIALLAGPLDDLVRDGPYWPIVHQFPEDGAKQEQQEELDQVVASAGMKKTWV